MKKKNFCEGQDSTTGNAFIAVWRRMIDFNARLYKSLWSFELQGEEIFLDMFEDEYRSMTVCWSFLFFSSKTNGLLFESCIFAVLKVRPVDGAWSFQSKPLNVEYLMMDASILLPPTGTPLTGIDFVKRLPCGDVEKTRRVLSSRMKSLRVRLWNKILHVVLTLSFVFLWISPTPPSGYTCVFHAAVTIAAASRRTGDSAAVDQTWRPH